MINIQRFVCNMLQENCYIASDETLECVIVDCGAFYDEDRKAIIDYIKGSGLRPVHLLATHGHLDHNFGNDTIFDAFGLSPEVAEADSDMIKNPDRQAEKFYGMRLDLKLPSPGNVLVGGDIIKFGNHSLKVLETPGHSRGSVTFYCEEESLAFTGDTLFRRSIGRTDFYGGNMMQIIQSLRMLAQLPDDTIIYPGHGEQTTIGRELAFNPYMER